MIGTKFNLIDLSQIPEQTEVVTTDSAPLILAAGPTARGTERMIEIGGKDFRTMFGDPDFKKYGQISVQCQRVIDAGGKLLFKRLVASDALLANSTIIAMVDTKMVDTNEVATDAEGNEITKTIPVDTGRKDEETGEPIIEEEVVPVFVQKKVCSVTYDSITLQDSKTLGDVTTNFGKNDVVDGAGIIPTAEEVAESDNPYGILLEEGQVLFVPTTENVSDELAGEEGIESGTYNGIWVVPSTSVDENGVFTGTASDIVSRKKIYPLFTITEIGRGTSNKTFTLTPENNISKNLPFMYYTLSIKENGQEIESVRFSMVPDTIYNGQCIDFNMSTTNSLKFTQAHSYEDCVREFITAVATSAEMDVEELEEHDFINGTLRKGTPFDGITIDIDAGLDMKTFEVTVDSPLNADGAFGTSPALTEAGRKLINEKMLAFYSDNNTLTTDPQEFDVTDDIYDLDTYQIDACFDANFDIKIKGAIAKLANYRGDFHYFRDHGFAATDYTTVENLLSGDYYEQINEGDGENIIKSTFVSDWVQSYEVINPYDLKQIKVTITYDLAADMISHIINNVNVPYAGKRNGAVITSIIKNTLNYKPRVTPEVDEKGELEDIKCNFASYYKEDFIIETLYTSQEEYTQLSFINNIMAVQRVIKALRVHFPSIRYQFITKAEDLNAYTTNINEFLSSYVGMFAELRFEYIQDSVAAANKIYRAALYFRFNDFAQGEQIDAYMLPTELVA